MLYVPLPDDHAHHEAAASLQSLKMLGAKAEERPHHPGNGGTDDTIRHLSSLAVSTVPVVYLHLCTTPAALHLKDISPFSTTSETLPTLHLLPAAHANLQKYDQGKR